MMEYALCVVVGVLVGAFLGKAPRKTAQQNGEPTEEEKRRSEKAWREYQNFMNYDGFPSQGED